MKRLLAILAALVATLSAATSFAAGDKKVQSATRQAEGGARMIGEGKIGPGVEETAKGVGNTVVEGAKYTGEKLKESAKAAEPQAKSSWESLKDSASAFGTSVKSFVTRLFSK